MSRLLAVIPPSTRRVDSAMPESASIASTTSRVCQPVASSTARARCPLVMYDVSPTTIPRASDRQCGANNPENAGTMKQPPLSATVSASVSISGALLISPRLSRNHCTSEPVIAIEPSSAYTGASSPIL